MYAAGEFTHAGGLFVNHIARWDGSQWHALGSGLSGSNYVLALTFDGDGRLYAGGYFGYAGDKQVNGVAMWNGLEWSALGGGMDDGVGALAVDANGYLYAGGDFQSAGATQADHIARWDGFTWSPLGSGTDSNVRALALVGNRLLVGGVFKKAGGIPSSYLGAYTFPPPEWAPAPALDNLSPAGIPAGGAGFWLTVDGTNFSSRSVVYWNGIPLTTTYLSGSRLRAFVPADKIGTPGTATILVSTPAPAGGGSSTTRAFRDPGWLPDLFTGRTPIRKHLLRRQHSVRYPGVNLSADSIVGRPLKYSVYAPPIPVPGLFPDRSPRDLSAQISL